jgi:hypothetical protein
MDLWQKYDKTLAPDLQTRAQQQACYTKRMQEVGKEIHELAWNGI